MQPVRLQVRWMLAAALVALPGLAQATEQVTLANGFDLTCDHTGVAGSRTLLYMDPGSTNYIEVETSTIESTQLVPGEPAPKSVLAAPATEATRHHVLLTSGELSQLLAGAGRSHDLDVDLLESVVHAESAGRPDARSRAGAEGLMQLMPATAKQLGVRDALAPRQNVAGGTAYLDALLTRYHDNLALALAAYNAGPGAVERWHGIPPYPETRAYVARIIHEFNRRYRSRQAAALALAAPSPKP